MVPCIISYAQSVKKEIFIRINQYGYHTNESKQAILFSNSPIKEKFEIVTENGQKSIASIKPIKSKAKSWGTFDNYYLVDFSEINQKGTYQLRGLKSGMISETFDISDQAENVALKCFSDYKRFTFIKKSQLDVNWKNR